MTVWPPDRAKLSRPVYAALADVAAAAIRGGRLRPGERLPTHRQLALDLGVSVQTVSRAYDELMRRGLAAGEVGRGTYVCGAAPGPGVPFSAERPFGGMTDLSITRPVVEQAQIDAMRRGLAALGQDCPVSAMASFRPATALYRYRAEAERWLLLCGLTLRRQGILITNGATAALALAVSVVARPGEVIATDALTHHGLRPLARVFGLRLAGVPGDAEGLRPDALEDLCRGGEVRALFVMPAGLGPQASVMGEERRRQIAALARRHDLAIVEDDAWGPMEPGRPAPVTAHAPERSFYVTTLTKCLLPGLRLGFMAMPERLESEVANRDLALNWMATPVMAELAARWIDDHTADDLLQRQRAALAERNVLAARILDGLAMRASPNGPHVWLPMERSGSDEALVAAARLQGVAVTAAGPFRAEPEASGASGIRVCLGGESVEALEDGLRLVARLLRAAEGNSDPARIL